MAGGLWAQKVQIGKESTAGTAVAASALWCGQGAMIQDDRNIVKPRSFDGMAVPGERNYTSVLGASWAMASTEATFEQLDYVLSGGLVDQISGTADGAGSSGYVRTYAPHGASNTALNTIKTFTIEAGDNQQAEEMEYSFVTDFKLEQVLGEAMMVSGNWMGRQAQPVSFTGSIAQPTVEVINKPVALWIDDSGGSIGSTAISSTIYKWSLDVVTGWVADPPRDNNLYFDTIRYSRAAYSAKLNVTFAHNATSVAEKADFRSNAARLFRLQSTGSAYGTAGSGTLFSGTKGFRLDAAGSYDAFSALGEQDGASIYEMTLDITYVPADALAFQIRLANEVATTP